jgi:hypothetical protein
MKLCIDWTFFLDVNTEAKCIKLVERIRIALGLPLENVKMERYWKDKQLFRVLAASCLDAPTATDGFYSIMKAVNGLSHRWIVNGPTEGGVWEFAGDASPDSLRISGIKLISFSTVGTPQTSQDVMAAHA